MKCHYEILGVSRDADDSEIKSAYRKLALRWHPDKNLNNTEEATEQFKLIQQAYEILSDPHERKWYDNHREQILRGQDSDFEDSCLDVFQYFTVSCFKGYNDDPDGFYSVYSNVFEKIAAEDAEFMDKEEFDKIPKFGNSKSNYEDTVGPFYAYWQSYCTKKSYAWLCPYNINEIKDRQILRKIEKDMKKIVQKAKRERNEEVRNLVSFIRKRDKRVQAYKKYLEEKAALNRQKQEQNRLEQIRKRKKEIEEMEKSQNQTKLNSDYEEQLKLLEQEYDDSDDYDSDYSESGDDYNDDSNAENSLPDLTAEMQLGNETDDNDNESNDDTFGDIPVYENQNYCVACDKRFKYQRSFQDHEFSEKHRENVNKLKAKMFEEENLYKKSKNQTNLINDNRTEKVTDDNTDKMNTKCNEKEDEDEDENGDEIKSINRAKSKKNKKLKRIKNLKNVDNENSNDEIEIHLSNFIQLSDKEDDNWDEHSKKSTKKSKGKKVGNQQKNSIANKQNNELSHQDDIKKTVTETKVSSSSSSLSSPTKKLSNIKGTNGIEIDVNHICVTCKSSFESKNKLFQHLKKMNHGVYIPKSATVVTTQAKTTATNKKGKKHK